MTYKEERNAKAVALGYSDFAEAVVALAQSGKSNREIGDIFDVTPSAIWHRINSAGARSARRQGGSNFKGYRRRREHIAQGQGYKLEELLRKLYAEGLSLEEIGKIFGVCADTVKRDFNYFGIEARKPYEWHFWRKEVLTAYENPTKSKEIG